MSARSAGEAWRRNWWVFRSVDKIAQYDSYQLRYLIAPRPLLLIHGTDADTVTFSRQAYDLAREPKELFWIEGASHVDLYDKDEYVTPAIAKLSDFFRQHLGEPAAEFAAQVR
ncbi:MAG: alpha/beta hydrolase [Chloroflexota bacterium]|nr:alpha/beta hydrolase [Chloroflexota bacterium]